MQPVSTGMRAILLVLLASGYSGVYAHHSRAGFDGANPMRMTGTVTEFCWVNPHILARIEVVDGKSMRIEQNGLLLAHQHLGLDYTPPPETATGGRGLPGGAGRAVRGEREPPGGFTPTPFGRDDFPGFGPPASDTGEESDNTGQE